jgi:hypothetical protein
MGWIMNRKILIIINNYVALPLKDRKSVKQIHDELFPKKTGVDTDKKREADLSNIDKEVKKKKQKKMNPPPVTTASPTAAFPRVSMSPSSGGDPGDCNAATGHSPDTAGGRSPGGNADSIGRVTTANSFSLKV